MHDKRRALLGQGAAAALAFPFIARSGFAATPKHTLKMVYPDVPTHPLMQVSLRFAERVKASTDGAVEVQVFTTGQLGSEVNMLTGLQSGIIDLCAHTSGFVQTLYPKFMVVDLPFLFRDSASAEKMLDSATGEKLLSELPGKGIYGLSYGHFGWRVVSTTKRHVPKPEDMKGLKIRVQPGAIFAATFSTLGAHPVPVDLSEVYLALSQGAIDAIETPVISVAASKHDEVVKVINRTNHVYNVGVMMASKRKLDALPKPYQEAIRKASTEMTPDWRQTIAQATAKTESDFKAKGIDIEPVDSAAYRKALEPVYTQFRSTIGDQLMDEVIRSAG